MFSKTRHKLGVFITYNKLWHPMMPNPHIKEQLCQVENFRDRLGWRQFYQLG
jgi:hypothetical protein